LAKRPKSFWGERREPLDPEQQWITYHDDYPAIRLESEIIYLCSLRGLQPPMADEMELWEIAAYLGLHRKETRAEHDTREITEAKSEYWDETGPDRMERMAKVAEERKARRLARKQERRQKREENRHVR
jgi:hypothetical protein